MAKEEEDARYSPGELGKNETQKADFCALILEHVVQLPVPELVAEYGQNLLVVAAHLLALLIHLHGKRMCSGSVKNRFI